MRQTYARFFSELPGPAISFEKNYKDEELGNLADSDVPYGLSWEGSKVKNLSLSNYREGSIRGKFLEMMITDQTYHSKMAMFLHSHFCTSFSMRPAQVFFREFALADLIRTFYQTDFIDILRKVTTNGIMLTYLNGYLNSKEQPDENYAREFFELFTRGVETYTQSDVVAAAKMFTGWRLSGPDQNEHNQEDAVFSHHFGNYVSKGAGRTPQKALEEMLNLVKGDVMARFIAKQLITWYVNSEVTEEYLNRVATAFRQRWSLEDAFYSLDFTGFEGVIVKSPLDFVIGIVNDFAIQFSSDLELRYREYNYLQSWMAKMGQQLGEPPNVAGWKAYYTDPMFYKDWISISSLDVRAQFIAEMISGSILQLDVMKFASKCTDPGDADLLVGYMSSIVAVPLPDVVKTEVRDVHLLNGLTPDIWRRAWNRYQQSGDASVIQPRITAAINYILSLPEYQLS